MNDITRFSPTASTGGLHLGHVFNFAINWWYAIKKGGKFFFAPECFMSPSTAPNVARCFNMARQFQLHHLCCVPPMIMQEGVLSQNPIIDLILNKAGINKSNPHHINYDMHLTSVSNALNDFAMGVNTIIRGRDWDMKNPDCNTLLKYLYHKSILEDLMARSGDTRKVKTYAHPLLVSRNDGKLSKSNEASQEETLENIITMWDDVPGIDIHASNRVLRTAGIPSSCGIDKKIIEFGTPNNKILPLSAMVYVMYLLDGKIPNDMGGILDYPNTLDIDKICGMDNIEVSIDDLRMVDKEIRGYISTSWGFEPYGLDTLSASWTWLWIWVERVR